MRARPWRAWRTSPWSAADAREAASRLLGRLAAAVRLVIGAPDYARYLAHHRQRHPETPPLSREEFERERLAHRYERPGSRCC